MGSAVFASPAAILGKVGIEGVATGAAWLCYWRALQEGPASVVAPVDRLSLLVTAMLSRVVLDEHASRRAVAGLALSLAGALLMALPAL